MTHSAYLALVAQSEPRGRPFSSKVCTVNKNSQQINRNYDYVITRNTRCSAPTPMQNLTPCLQPIPHRRRSKAVYAGRHLEAFLACEKQPRLGRRLSSQLLARKRRRAPEVELHVASLSHARDVQSQTTSTRRRVPTAAGCSRSTNNSKSTTTNYYYHHPRHTSTLTRQTQTD